MENNVKETAAQNTNQNVEATAAQPTVTQPETALPAPKKSLTRQIIEGVVEGGIVGLAIFGGYVLVRGIIGGASGAAEAAEDAASALR